MARQGAGARKLSQTSRTHQQRVAGHRAAESDPSEDLAAEQGLQQERGEGRPGIEEAEETHQRLALAKIADDFRLEQIVDQCRERRGECDHQGEIAKQRHAPDLGPSAPAVFLHRRSSTPRGHAATDEHGTRHARGARQSQQTEHRSLGQEDRHALRADASSQAAKGARRGDSRHQRLGRVRVEALVEQRPER